MEVRGKMLNILQAHEKKIQSTDVLDNVESVNIPKFISHYEKEPFHPFFHPYRAEIEAFSRVRTSNLSDILGGADWVSSEVA